MLASPGSPSVVDVDDVNVVIGVELVESSWLDVVESVFVGVGVGVELVEP